MSDVLWVKNVACSLPRVVGAKGVTQELHPDLNDAERDGLRGSAEMLKDMVEQVALDR